MGTTTSNRAARTLWRFAAVVTVAAVLAACGDADPAPRAAQPSATAAPSSAAATVGSAAPAGSTGATGTAAVTSDAAAEPSSPATPPDASGRASTDCPSAADVGAAYGADVELDEESAMTGAVGLVFCPYTEIVPPDVTNQFGLPASPDTFSLTFTNQNPVVDDGSGPEAVAGVGEQATWSEIGELAVWTGDRGLIVMLESTPPSGDARATAIALAHVALP